MSDDKKPSIPTCPKCGSKQIRTTTKQRICIRCGHREELE